jgi:integrase
MSGNLVRKGNIWHVRLAIPEDVQHAFGFRKVLTRSLGTSNKGQAQLLKAEHILTWKALIKQARQGAPLPNDWAEQITDVWQQLDDDVASHAVSLVGQGEYEERDIEIDPVWFQHPELVELSSLLATMNDYINGEDSSLEEKIEYKRELANAFKEATPKLFEKRFKDRSPEEEAQLKTAIESPQEFTVKHPITNSLISSWREFLKTQLDKEKTIDSHISRVRKIAKYLTENNMDLSFDSVHSFIKNSGLSKKTITNYLWSGSNLWDWAKQYNPTFKKRQKDNQNPFSGHRLPRNKAAQGQIRKAFSRVEIEAIYTAVIQEEKTELSKLITIAAYTGMRLEEIGRIQKDDITYSENHPYSIHIPEAKSEAGIRDVPIHPAIAELIASLVLKSEDSYLIKGKPNKYGERLGYLSKQFGRIKKKLGFSNEYAFHSIRKTTATELQQAGVDALTLPAILGHEIGLVTYDIYSNGPSMEQKHDAIRKLEFTFKGL